MVASQLVAKIVCEVVCANTTNKSGVQLAGWYGAQGWAYSLQLVRSR